MKKNPLYSPNDGDWVTLLIQEQLEAIRTHLDEGDEKSVHGSRIDAALRAAIDYLNRGK